MTSIESRRGRFTVRAFVDGRRRSFGTFATREEAEERASTVEAPDMRLSQVSMAQRLLERSTRTASGCRVWTGHTDTHGYGRISSQRPGRVTYPALAHRESYKAFVGPLIEGLTIDHTCHNADPACPGGDRCAHRRCIEPSHLEQVSLELNNARARSQRVMRLTEEKNR